MNGRINKSGLMTELSVWNSFLKRKVRLIACGGTAMTLMGIKPSTKDIDLLVPEEKEYKYLIKTIKQLGYKSARGSGWSREGGFIYDLFQGSRVHTTELLESPLDEGNNMLINEFSHIYLGALNYYDLIISKLFRGAGIDFEDCITLHKARKKGIDLEFLEKRFRETASFDVSEEKVNKNLDYFLDSLKKQR
jgi:hypothetical protein